MILSILQKCVKIVNNSTVEFLFKDKMYCLFFDLNFWLNFLTKYFEIYTECFYSPKLADIGAFSPL